MKSIPIQVLLTGSLISFHFALGQDPYVLLGRVQERVKSIADYSADLVIEVDVDFINIPVKHATMYYKQPDKLKFKSDEFIMLPKRGLTNQVHELLNEPYNAFLAGTEQIHGRDHTLVKIIPMSKKPDIILSTWWIDEELSRISRVESSTRDQGTFRIDFNYLGLTDILPEEMIVNFEVEGVSIPLKFIGQSKGIQSGNLTTGDKREGTVRIRFSNYKINQSLKDSFFDSEPE